MAHSNQLLYTAYHEAGHVALHLWLECPFENVSIVEDDESAGRVMGGTPILIQELMRFKNNNGFYRELNEEDERTVRSQQLIALAGAAAEQLYCGKTVFSYEIEKDNNDFATFCMLLNKEGDQIFEEYKRVWSSTVEILNQKNVREFIKTLVEHLVQNKELYYSDCQKLYELTC